MADTSSEDTKKFNIIYPAYINSARSVYRGRRVPVKNGVNEPKITEIKEALEIMKGFHIQPEQDKIYCREIDKELVSAVGRIKYLNMHPDRNSCTNKKQVLLTCAETINKFRSQRKPATVQQPSEQTAETSKKAKKKNQQK